MAVLIFDLWHRLYGYPLEYVIESMAPTTERDFDLLPPERQHIYRHLQATNIHGSPDGPWFFIIARNDPERRSFDLIGITDTSMLRPQVFALQDGEVQIGLICSEKQAIDATLASLAEEDPRICPVADLYWNARGGSATDGGAFIFSLEPNNGRRVLSCHDKFGKLQDRALASAPLGRRRAGDRLPGRTPRRPCWPPPTWRTTAASSSMSIRQTHGHHLLRQLPGVPGGGGRRRPSGATPSRPRPSTA